MKKHSRFKTARNFLVFWSLFIGIGAVAGAVGMLSDPTGKAMGMDAMLPYFKVLPFSDILFRDFVFSGISLLIVNGLTNLLAAGLIFAKKKAGIVLGGIFGVTLMLWICIQFYMFPLNFMSTAYFIFGLIQALTGYAAYVFLKQENFKVDIGNYPGIGQNGRNLVVFFSRMGYVKKAAYETADKTGADIYEIKAKEHTSGTSGFFWCGRFGMHKWEMPIEKPDIELEKYDKVTVCTPIWVFHIASPVRTFCKIARGRIAKADFITVHYNRYAYPEAAKEMDSLLGLTDSGYESICSRQGKLTLCGKRRNY